MTASADNAMLGDEELVAFLDGELPLEERRRVNRALAESADARQRLERLRTGDRPFREAFDLLERQAPMDRLRPMLAEAERRAGASASPAAGGRAPMAAAAAILLALVGGFAGGILLQPEPGEVARTAPVEAPAERGWRQAVADYQSLFTTESLTPYQGGDSGIELASATVGLELKRLAQNTDELNFRRVQVLRFNGKPLIQFAFLSADGIPVSFCVIPSGNEPAPESFETRNDMGVVHWVEDGFGYMVIGGMPQERLFDVAHQLKMRLPA
ncbi:anti-sigma factor family protein [Minwuia thermotolerans]|uniref:Zinc-finger domain-containing protein n=1 Tax=Minwuia thermotolerans TaxID=2056226 RepID=A0A2M9G640_9PROT|nr:hypothetical protein [Minwuia thermotolerans]PJK31185.1 hypothetical protein CVT23_02840 [Minwuia thermotolerans]